MWEVCVTLQLGLGSGGWMRPPVTDACMVLSTRPGKGSIYLFLVSMPPAPSPELMTHCCPERLSRYPEVQGCLCEITEVLSGSC